MDALTIDADLRARIAAAADAHPEASRATLARMVRCSRAAVRAVLGPVEAIRFETRKRILEIHEAHPELRNHDQIAAFASRELGYPVSRPMVRSVLPPLVARGHRMVIPARLYQQFGSEEAVIAALREYLAGQPKPPA